MEKIQETAEWKEPEFEVTVIYEGFDIEKDNNIKDFAKEYGGTKGDSGCGFGERDMCITFNDSKSAESFRKAIKKAYKWVRADKTMVFFRNDWHTLKEYKALDK